MEPNVPQIASTVSSSAPATSPIDINYFTPTFRHFPPYIYGGSRRRSFDFTAAREIILRSVGHPSVCGQNPSDTQAASRNLVKTQCGPQSEAPQSRRQSALVVGPKKPLRRIFGYPQAVPGLATRLVVHSCAVVTV